MDKRKKKDAIGNKVDIMAGVIMIVNDCNNNGYKILLKQVVALENVFEGEQSVERLHQSLKELKLPWPPKLVDEQKVEVGDVFRKCRLIKDIEDKFAELEHNALCEKRGLYFSIWIACLGELLSENAFSSTGIKICSLVCTRFPETNMLSDKKLLPKFGHNSLT